MFYISALPNSITINSLTLTHRGSHRQQIWGHYITISNHVKIDEHKEATN